MPGEENRSHRRLIVLGLLMEAGYLTLGLPATPLGLRVTIQCLLFLPYAWALREGCRRPLGNREGAALLGLAVLFRLTLVFLPPFYSDDLYRYLWDGRVQVAGGLNPYRFAPDDPNLAPLAGDLRARVNHPDLPTLYPPVAQGFFAAVAGLGGSVALLKACLVSFDLALLLLIRVMLRRAGLSEGRMLIYAWCPLVIAEVAGNGHVDALAIFFLLLGIHLIIMARATLSTVSLGLSAGAKFLPVLVFPVLATRVRRRFWAIPFVVLGLAYLPYLGAGRALFSGLRQYAERWQHNDSLFRILLGLLEWLQPTPWLKSGIAWLQERCGFPPWIDLLYRYAYPVYLARITVVVGLAVLALRLAQKRVAPIRGAFLLLGSGLLLSPTVHPWYALWLVPFLVFIPSRAWILFTGLVSLSYLDPGPVGGSADGHEWVRWIEYLPFLSLLAVDYLRARRGKPATLYRLPAFGGAEAAPPGTARAEHSSTLDAASMRAKDRSK